MYGVSHNGGCGFLSFIPIMLAYLPKDGHAKKWMQERKQDFESAARKMDILGERIQKSFFDYLVKQTL